LRHIDLELEIFLDCQRFDRAEYVVNDVPDRVVGKLELELAGLDSTSMIDATAPMARKLGVPSRMASILHRSYTLYAWHYLLEHF
jgi:hypothetical protein